MHATENVAKKDNNAVVKIQNTLNQPQSITTQQPQVQQMHVSAAPILQQVLSNQSAENILLVSQNRPNIIQMNPTSLGGSASSITTTVTPTITSSSSLIKSLLANKVNADGSSCTTTVTSNIASPNITANTTNVNLYQVTLFCCVCFY